MNSIKYVFLVGVLLVSAFSQESRGDEEVVVPIGGTTPFFVPSVKRYDVSIVTDRLEPSAVFLVRNNSDRVLHGDMTITVTNESGQVRTHSRSHGIGVNSFIRQSWPHDLDEGLNNVEVRFVSGSTGRSLAFASTAINYTPPPSVCTGPVSFDTSGGIASRTVDLGDTGGTVRVSFRGASPCLINSQTGQNKPCPAYTLTITPANSSTPIIRRQFSGGNVSRSESFSFNPNNLGTSRVTVRIESTEWHIGEAYVTCPGGSIPGGSRNVTFTHRDGVSTHATRYQCPADLWISGRGLFNLNHNQAQTIALGLGGVVFQAHEKCFCASSPCIADPEPEIVITGQGGGWIQEDTFSGLDGVFFIGTNGRVRVVE